MTKREFLGGDFCAFVQQEYDTARRYLKNCGKPVDQYDLALIQIHKETSTIFKPYLGE